MTANFVFSREAEATSSRETETGLGEQSYVSARLLESGPGGSKMELARRRLLHAPIEPWKNPGARAGQGQREQRRPGPDAVMEKPIRAPARGRRAWQPQHLAGRSGGAAPCQNHRELGEVPGAGKMRDGSPRSGWP